MHSDHDLGCYVLLQAKREGYCHWVLHVAASIIQKFRLQSRNSGKSLAIVLDFRRIELVAVAPLHQKVRGFRNAPASPDVLCAEWKEAWCQEMQDIKSELAGQGHDEFGEVVRRAAARELEGSDVGIRNKGE
jgi:hypothetical protein